MGVSNSGNSWALTGGESLSNWKKRKESVTRIVAVLKCLNEECFYLKQVYVVSVWMSLFITGNRGETVTLTVLDSKTKSCFTVVVGIHTRNSFQLCLKQNCSELNFSMHKLLKRYFLFEYLNLPYVLAVADLIIALFKYIINKTHSLLPWLS